MSSAKATSGQSNVNIKGTDYSNISAIIQSFALDIPRQVGSAVRLWGITLLLIALLGTSISSFALYHKMIILEEYLERQEKSTENLNNKYNRLARYIRTGDKSALSKEARSFEEE